MKNISLLSLVLLLTAMSLTDDVYAGRKRISTEVVENQYSVKDIEKEIVFGREMSAIILANYQLMDHEQLNRYVNLVGHVLLQHATRQEISFHFAVIDSPIINAYAAPGGYIFVTRGAMDLMQSEAELAGVLAHEISHVTERHIVKALKIKAQDDSIEGSLGRVVGSSGSSANVIFDQAVNKAVEILFSKGLQREDEFNADERGIILTSVAGYDPEAYYQYLKRIKPLVEKNHGQLNKTHPPLSDRMKKLQVVINTEGLNDLGGHNDTVRFENYYQSP